MAHFAKLDENNIVTTVEAVSNDVLNSDIDEETGLAHLRTTHNDPTSVWKQTSYNTYENQHLLGGTPYRGSYAIIGGKWLPDVELFQPPQPYPSWTWSNDNAKWSSPTPYPSEEAPVGKNWAWDETQLDWILVNNEIS
jgi:hypothetical protein